MSSDLFFRNNDNMVLSFTFSPVYWGTTSSCNLLGGVVSTSMATRAVCTTTASNTVLIIRNFKGFETNPLLPTSKNIRVKILFKGTGLSGLDSSTSRTVTVRLYANYDAFINNYQAIVRGAANLNNNCYYPAIQSSTCYYSHSSGGGNFFLQRVTDTFVQVSFNPTSTIGFGSGGTYHYFEVEFGGFDFGSSCTITDLKVEITYTNTPGQGINNTATPTVNGCYGDRMRI